MKLMAFFETHFNQVGFYRKYPAFLCVSSEAGGSPREIIAIKIGIDLRAFHWVKIVFYPVILLKIHNSFVLNHYMKIY